MLTVNSYITTTVQQQHSADNNTVLLQPQHSADDDTVL